MKTNTGLVNYAKAQLGLPYWYGTFGQTANASLYGAKKSQYPKYYTSSDYSSQYGKRVHDCVGLIKGYLWSESTTSKPTYKAAQDVSADGMLSRCTEKGTISTIPQIPGILVFKKGHVGVYIGNGEVVEARGHAYGVVKTKLSTGNWKSWGKCPFITYVEVEKPKPVIPEKPAAENSNLKVGDIVNFAGGYHYKNASSTLPTGLKRTSGQAKITAVSKGSKHPYHLIGTSSNVYGWVNSDGVSKPGAPQVGDIVSFKGGFHYKGSNDASPVGLKRKAGTAKITAINKGSKHPYHLVGKSSNVYGWVDSNTI